MNGATKMKSMKSSDKKQTMAKKMGSTKSIIEGDASHMGPQDNFSKKEVSKEKGLRREEKKFGDKYNWIT